MDRDCHSDIVKEATLGDCPTQELSAEEGCVSSCCHFSQLLGPVSSMGFWLCSVLGMSSPNDQSMLIISGNYESKG